MRWQTWLVCTLIAVSSACGETAETPTQTTTDTASETSESGGECSECAKDSDCGDGLTCDKPAFVCKTPKQVKVGAPVCDIDCAESDFCKDDGLCSIEGKICKAVILAHCIASNACKTSGRCSVVDGKCKVTSDHDCQQGTDCKVDGKCTHKDGACEPTANIKCGDGKCEGSETKQTCEADCGKIGGDPCPCGAGVCGVKPGCPNDCGSCADNKWCFNNQCTDAQCKLPEAWPQPAQRISKLVLLNHKNGCDLDDSGKPNNMLGNVMKVYGGVNEYAFNAIQGQTLNLLFVSDNYHAGGKPFSIALIDAVLDKTAGSCNPEHSACKYKARAHSYNVLAKSATCPAVTVVDNGKVEKNALTAGGTGHSLSLAVYVVGVPLVAKLQAVQMTGTVSGGSEWQSTEKGLICGAIAATDFDKAVDALPESALKGTGFTKAKVKELVDGLFKPDIDLDGDGKLDALSAAWAFETHPAEILGVQ